jgi:hypothetical protein
LGSAAISWNSKKQATVALSSTEAKYRGADITTSEEIWLRRSLAHLGEYIHCAIIVWCDYMNSILLAKNLVFYSRRKHIEAHYHFLREKIIDLWEVNLQYVNTNAQVATIFTKGLIIEKHAQFKDILGVLSIDMNSSKHVEK